MEALAIYLLKSASWLTGFAVIYYIFLRNERFFLLKRIFLIAGIIISFIFPLISFHYQVEVPSSDLLVPDLIQAGRAAIPVSQPVSPEKPLDFRIILLFLYLAGVIFLAFRMALHIRVIYKTIKRANINNKGPVRLVRASEYPSSFSFFNYVFINPSVSETETEEIMNHELVHVRQKHWFDLLLVEILRLVQWANPFAWIYTGFIRLNHEYLADEAALQRTSNPAIYKAALVNQLLCAPVISLANSFNYSLNKKRFEMMKKIITSPYRKMKVLFILPVFAILFYAFAIPEYHYAVPSDNSMTIIQAPVIIVKDVRGVVLKEDGTPFAGVPILVTGTTIRATTDDSGNFTLTGVPDDASIVFSFRGYLTQVLRAKFTKGMEVKLQKDPEYKENAVTSFRDSTPHPIVIRSGNMTAGQAPNALIVINGVISDRQTMDSIDRNSILSISVLKDEMATSKYGERGKDGVIEVKTKKGEPIIVIDDVISTKTAKEAMRDVTFDQIAVMKSLSPKEATDKYGEKGKYGATEIMTLKRAAELGIKVPFRRRNPEDFPTFRGKSYMSFKDWVISQVKYPAETSSKELKGWVHIKYTIEPDGSVTNVKPIGYADPVLNEIVANIVRSSPKWEPAKNPEAKEPYTGEVSVKFESPGKVANEVEPFVVVEEMPMYPGGDETLLKFISENTHYPDLAKANKTQGRVIVRFIVTPEGNTEDAMILKGVDPLLDAEAVRVVSQLSGFKPGYQGGKAVPVWYMVPITFSLN